MKENLHRDSLDIYCQEMSRQKLPKKLSQQETITYFTRYQEIRQALLNENMPAAEVMALEKERAKIVSYVTSSCLPYVVKLAQDFSRGTADKELLAELIAAGNEGLCKAVGHFKHDVGTPFHYYASTWIKAMIRTSLKQHHNLVKNAPSNTTSTYFDGYPQGFSVPKELQESFEPLSEDDMIYEERKRQLRTAIQALDPVTQFICNLCSGQVTERNEKFTAVARMFGVGFSTAFVKAEFQSGLDSISTDLLTASIKS